MRNLAALLAISALSCTLQSAPDATAAEKAKEDLPNFHQTEPYLYRGGEPTEHGLELLKEKGVDSIVDLRGTGPVTEKEQRQAEKLGMHYLNLPMDSHAPSKEAVAKFVKTVEAAKNGPPGKSSVFVHCQHGSDRTGCLIGIWRVTHDGWGYDKAYEEMRKYYFGPKFTNLSGAVKEYCGKSVD